MDHEVSPDSLSYENISFQKVIAVVGVALMSIKFIAWWMTSSVSVLTDALESIVNVIAAFVGLFALYLSAKPHDKEYPYGHGKIELISSALEGTLILAAGAMIILEAVDHILHPAKIGNLDIGFLFLVLAAIVNYLVGVAAIRRGRKNRSLALVASGKHLCSDTISSIGVIAGLILMMALGNMGYEVGHVDSVMAALFGIIIIITGVKVVKESVEGIMDKTDEDLVVEIIGLINSKRRTQWIDIHALRVTKHGPAIHLEFHLVLPGTMTVADQSREISNLCDVIHEKYGEYIDATVMGESCKPMLCEHCSEECASRAKKFCGYIDWDMATATDETEFHSSSGFEADGSIKSTSSDEPIGQV